MYFEIKETFGLTWSEMFCLEFKHLGGGIFLLLIHTKGISQQKVTPRKTKCYIKSVGIWHFILFFYLWMNNWAKLAGIHKIISSGFLWEISNAQNMGVIQKPRRTSSSAENLPLALWPSSALPFAAINALLLTTADLVQLCTNILSFFFSPAVFPRAGRWFRRDK